VRARAGLIAQDLLALDLSPTQLTLIPQCQTVAPFTTVVEALGWVYAIERASLLHELIRHHLLQHIENIDNAIAYLSAHRGVAAERWAELGDAIDLVAISPVVVDKMIGSAIAAFECAHAWFRPSYAQVSSLR
jgi:heme oxygenase